MHICDNVKLLSVVATDVVVVVVVTSDNDDGPRSELKKSGVVKR